MITENFVESSIASEHYFTAADGRAGAIANGTYTGVERPLANDGFGGTMTKKGSRRMKVFLGGTCNESDWRNRIIPMLEVGFFNPVVDDWTPDCMAEELRQREECDVCLYVITPKMTGVYSVAEVIDDSNKRPARTVFVRLRDDGDEKFTDGQWKSLGAVAQMVERNGGTAFDSLKSAALHINAQLV